MSEQGLEGFQESLCPHPDYRFFLSFLDIRRTAITNWFYQGLSIHDVMKLAGHAKFKSTHRFYLDVADDLVARARQANDKAVGQNWHALGTHPLLRPKMKKANKHKCLPANGLQNEADATRTRNLRSDSLKRRFVSIC